MAGRSRVTNGDSMPVKAGLNSSDIKVVEEVYKVGRGDADRELSKMKEQVNLSNQIGLISGRAQAFKAMKLIAEFLEWKQIAEIINNKDFLKLPGITNVDSYLESLGLGRSTAYNNLKIARSLTHDEVQLLGQVGFTRKDLLGYASLPDEKRMEIREGKVINLEKADREEIREIIEQILQENRQIREEKDRDVKHAERMVEQKRKLSEGLEKEIVKLEKDIETLRASIPEEEKDFIRLLGNKYMEIYGHALLFRKEVIESNNIPSPAAGTEVVNFLGAVMRTVTGLYQEAYDRFGAPSVVAGDDWIPPHLREAQSIGGCGEVTP